MNTQRVWNPAAIHEYSAAWLRSGTGEDSVRTNMERFTTYLAGNGGWKKVALGSMSLQLWNYRKGTVLLWNGDLNGLKMLHLAACATFVIDDLNMHNMNTFPLAERAPCANLSDTAFALATFIALGAVKDAEATFELILRCLREERVICLDCCVFPRYLLMMFAAWKRTPIVLDGAGLRSMGAYDDLLAVWDTTELPVLKAALDAACDLHIARSRASTLKAYYDFEPDWTRLFPAEILSMLRLRELKGIPNPEMDHRLMVLPTARLYPVQQYTWDPILLAAYRKAIIEVETPPPAPKKPWWRLGGR